jgi:hypothetical protein
MGRVRFSGSDNSRCDFSQALNSLSDSLTFACIWLDGIEAAHLGCYDSTQDSDAITLLKIQNLHDNTCVESHSVDHVSLSIALPLPLHQGPLSNCHHGISRSAWHLEGVSLPDLPAFDHMHAHTRPHA